MEAGHVWLFFIRIEIVPVDVDLHPAEEEVQQLTGIET
jgi:hypothetical protein